MESLDSLCWPLSSLGEAIVELGHMSNLVQQRETAQLDFESNLTAPDHLGNSADSLGRWVEAAAEWLGLEAEPFNITYAEIERVLRFGGPFMMSLPVEGELRFLAVLCSKNRDVLILSPGKRVQRLKQETVRTIICHDLEAPLTIPIDKLLRETGVPPKRRVKVRAALIRDRLSNIQICNCWMLRLPPGAGFLRHLRQAKLPKLLLGFLGAQAIQYVLFLVSWAIIGQAALKGDANRGWFLAWGLLLFTMVLFRLISIWLQGVISVSTGALLKQRLLYGALRLDPEDIRQEGSGQLLGRVIESSAIESLALAGGFLGLAAVIEIIMTIVVLALSASAGVLVPLFAVWISITLLIGSHYYRRRNHWTEMRFGITNDLVERMLGHRTRLAQEPREHWHYDEDRMLAQYIEVSMTMDRSSLLLRGLIPRGWLLLGLIGLSPYVISGGGSSTSIAVGIGGLLLGYQALEGLTGSLAQLASAIIAWKQVAVLFKAAAQKQTKSSPVFVEMPTITRDMDEGQILVDAQDLAFTYRGRSDPILRNCNLQIRSGDRILLEGHSGEGKSTLASLLVGLRYADSGLLLLNGLDHKTLGPQGWRRRVTAAPQFHENHVLTGTLAFNLLMGRRWPPQPEDLFEADAICRELGLGDLVDRMPSGLMQSVGETGWRLSHGELSRLYIARALLQGVDLIVLDESFAALDPNTLKLALRCVFDRTSTLLVIAHP